MEAIALEVENLTDARYFAAMGSPYIGFTTGKNNSLPFEKIAAIIEWVSGSQLLLEFDSNDLDYMTNYINQLKPAAVLITPNLVSQISKSPDRKIGLKLECKAFLEFTAYNSIDFIVVNIDEKDLKLIDHLKERILNIGIAVYFDFMMPFSLYENQLNNLDLKGLIVKGGEEEQVGVKSYDEIDKIFDYLEESA